MIIFYIFGFLIDYQDPVIEYKTGNCEILTDHVIKARRPEQVITKKREPVI